jgi:hypothetical protein
MAQRYWQLNEGVAKNHLTFLDDYSWRTIGALLMRGRNSKVAAQRLIICSFDGAIDNSFTDSSL